MLRTVVRHAALAVLLCVGCGPAIAGPDFALDVRPILERSCFGCHGPEKQRSGYRLDVRDIAIKGGDSGEIAIKPHDAANSPLIHYVSGEDEDLRMPPARSSVPPLTAEEVGVLRAWIDAGPNWPDELAGEVEDSELHWSLGPLVLPELPRDAPNAIDAFILAKLEEQGIKPSPNADRRTLIRRVSYDLTGLPPAPEEVDAFLADPDPMAYENLVDKLLASPRYGERWARHWLDTIHFADSHGYEHDIARENAWRYRDYVIAAFNSDTPWPRFIREQLATDYFYPEEPQLTPALGYLGAGTFDLSTYTTAPITFDYLDRDDLVTQTMSAFVSTTANCARCHAHKFDPISQEDYYALQAVFSGVLKGDVAYDEDPEVARERSTWLNILEAAETRDSEALLLPEFDPPVREWIASRGSGAQWTPLDVETFVSVEGATQYRGEDGVIVSSDRRADKDTYTITATTSLTEITALRLDVYALDSLPMNGPGRQDNGNFHLTKFEAQIFEPGSGQPIEVEFRRATADFNQTDWEVDYALDDDQKTAWGIHPAVGEPHHAVFELVKPLTLQPGSRLAISLKQLHGDRHLIGAFSLSATADPAERAVSMPVAVADALTAPVDARTEDQRITIAAYVLRFVAESELEQLPEQSVVYAAASTVETPNGETKPRIDSLSEPKVVHVLDRGDFDKPIEPVGPGALSALTHSSARFELSDPSDEARRRAALAEWIAHPDNVLTWRSIVNRVWHYHFGRGLCDTPSDFGQMGGAPSHSELIDWLAVWFRDEAHGSLKELHRLIVTSATYRQSSQHRDDAVQIDADNRLLWRQNRQRLDADAYRDFTLSVSGTLDLTMGGPGVQHFSQGQGPQLTPALDYKAFDWNGEGAGRRSIYRFVWRGIADPFMEALDFPDLGHLSPSRGFSASSLQALALFNNDFVLHHSSALANRVETEERCPDAQAIRAVRLVWLRYPNDAERIAFIEYASAHGLPALCRVLLNSNEYLFVD